MEMKYCCMDDFWVHWIFKEMQRWRWDHQSLIKMNVKENQPSICSQMYNKIFLKKLSKELVPYKSTHLLAPFASKLVNYSSHSEPLKNA